MTKKMTKQVWLYALIALFVCAAIVGVAVAFTSTASAGTITGDETGTGTVNLTYTVKGNWSVSVSDVDDPAFKVNTAKDIKVEVTEAVLASGKTLKVTVSGKNSDGDTFRLKHEQANDYIVYELKIKDGDAITSTNKDIITGITGESNLESPGVGEVTLQATLPEANAQQAKYSGSYEDTLTFTVTVA